MIKQFTMSVIPKGAETSHNFSFESINELKNAVQLVACVLGVKLPDTTDSGIDLGSLIQFETSTCIIQAFALPF